jgi:hypothetical protein
MSSFDLNIVRANIVFGVSTKEQQLFMMREPNFERHCCLLGNVSSYDFAITFIEHVYMFYHKTSTISTANEYCLRNCQVKLFYF